MKHDSERIERINKINENDIQIGEYVRTKKGKIDIVHCEVTDKWFSKNNEGETIVRCEDDIYLLKNIVKHSFNIIDLIEVGDYVNGEKILSISLKRDYLYAERIAFKEKDIKSIVTKEQFESIKYEVKIWKKTKMK